MPFRELLAIQRRIFGYVLPYWKVATGALVFTVLVAGTRLAQAKLIGMLFGVMSAGKATSSHVHAAHSSAVKQVGSLIHSQDPWSRLNFVVLAFLVLIVLRGFGWYCQKYLTDLAGQSAIRDLRSQVFAHLQSLSMRYFESTRLGEIQARSTSDVILATGIYGTLSDFLKNFLVVVGALGAMFYEDYQMTFLVLLLSPLIAIAVSRFGKKMAVYTDRLQQRVADLSAILIENTSSQKVIKAYHREKFEIARYDDTNEQNFGMQMKLVQVAATQTPVVEFLSVLGIIAIVYFGTARVLQGNATISSMVEFWALMAMIIQPLTVLSTFYANLQSSSAAGRRVFAMLDEPPDVLEKEGAIDLPSIKGKVSFCDVRFSYDQSKEVLRGIDLEVEEGEVVAIVGTNGAGKTTFVNLVPRFYDPTRGSVAIDGHDIREVTLKSLRTQIGIVIQESILFGGSISENIACGRNDFTHEQIVEAAKIANADEFIQRMPQGYDTEVGERGVRLSGGQRQRVAIARALLREPKILILDEFTSGIDTESENLITQAIERIMKGRTCLVIAHRLNTIRRADRIVVVDGGRIVEEGTHDRLLSQSGLYARLYEAQLRTPVGA